MNYIIRLRWVRLTISYMICQLFSEYLPTWYGIIGTYAKHINDISRILFRPFRLNYLKVCNNIRLMGYFHVTLLIKKSINRIQYNSFRTQITSWVINHSLTTIIRNHFLQQVRFREDSWGLRDIVTYLGNAQSILGSSTWTNKNRENRVSKLHIILHNYIKTLQHCMCLSYK